MLTPESIIKAYRLGYFPMAKSRHDSEVVFVAPQQRCLLPIADFHIHKRLRRELRQQKFTIAFNQNFRTTIAICAECNKGRQDTWINAEIETAFTELHDIGLAHSVEAYDSEGRLSGGLYGLALGGAFFGESMFHRQASTSKIALCHLVARLYYGGYRLLDGQFDNEHLRQFGSHLVSHEHYMELLESALRAGPTKRLLDGQEAEEMQKFLNRKDF